MKEYNIRDLFDLVERSSGWHDPPFLKKYLFTQEEVSGNKPDEKEVGNIVDEILRYSVEKDVFEVKFSDFFENERCYMKAEKISPEFYKNLMAHLREQNFDIDSRTQQE